MALRAVSVGPVAVDAAATLAAGLYVLENLGDRSLRFVAGAPGEAAPADPRDGHLLLPGAREAISVGGPVWVWSDYPARVGLTPSWFAGGVPGSGGGGRELLFAGAAVETALVGVHAIGATVLTVAATADLTLDRVQVGGELHTIEAIDEVAATVTIEASGLIADQVAGAQVVQAPLLGGDDVLALPAPSGGAVIAELDVRLLYDMPQLNGNPSFYNGRSTGSYFAHGGRVGSYFETLSNFSYWWANAQVDPASTWSVGLIHATGNPANAWSLEFDPVALELSLIALDTESFLPRIYSLIVAGRGV